MKGYSHFSKQYGHRTQMTIKTRFDQGEAGNIRLDDLTIRMVADEPEKAEWNRLIVEYHYLHDSTLAEPQIRYTACGSYLRFYF